MHTSNVRDAARRIRQEFVARPTLKLSPSGVPLADPHRRLHAPPRREGIDPAGSVVPARAGEEDSESTIDTMTTRPGTDRASPASRASCRCRVLVRP
jgi:hypothetical protein